MTQAYNRLDLIKAADQVTFDLGHVVDTNQEAGLLAVGSYLDWRKIGIGALQATETHIRFEGHHEAKTGKRGCPYYELPLDSYEEWESEAVSGLAACIRLMRGGVHGRQLQFPNIEETQHAARQLMEAGHKLHMPALCEVLEIEASRG